MAQLPNGVKFGDIYLQRGKSLLDKLICWRTLSRYNHAGIVLDPLCGSVVEALPHGVTMDFMDSDETVYLTPCVPLTPREQFVMRIWLNAQINKPYDYKALIGFMLFNRWNNPYAYYCFELVYDAYKAIGRELFRLDDNYIDGHLLYSSNGLELIK